MTPCAQTQRGERAKQYHPTPRRDVRKGVTDMTDRPQTPASDSSDQAHAPSRQPAARHERGVQRQRGYEPPTPIEISPLLDWPPRPVASARYLLSRVMLPYGAAWIGLAVLVWNFLTPSMQRMSQLRPRWALEVYLRNAALFTLLAGGLHLALYIQRVQQQRFKYIPRWGSTSRTFLWNSQVRDNMFWCLTSGCAIWSAYECGTYWAYANGHIPQVQWHSAPVYLAGMAVVVFLWSVTHFYLNHRLLHTRWLYDHAHYLHHRNVNTGPWSGISMHPLEHVIYFSVVLLWWVVPVHPVIVILCMLFQGMSPAVSHSGFERVELAKGATAPAGDYFHHLHHRFFECNYGNRPVPIDKLFGTFHDGTPEAHARMKARMRARRGQRAVAAEAAQTGRAQR